MSETVTITFVPEQIHVVIIGLIAGSLAGVLIQAGDLVSGSVIGLLGALRVSTYCTKPITSVDHAGSCLVSFVGAVIILCLRLHRSRRPLVERVARGNRCDETGRCMPTPDAFDRCAHNPRIRAAAE
jgi:uncharacterized membrane protein YeaQ/YmgE (transglycosylase-associated protein family)